MALQREEQDLLPSGLLTVCSSLSSLKLELSQFCVSGRSIWHTEQNAKILLLDNSLLSNSLGSWEHLQAKNVVLEAGLGNSNPFPLQLNWSDPLISWKIIIFKRYSWASSSSMHTWLSSGLILGRLVKYSSKNIF